MTLVKARPKTSSWFTIANPKLALAEIGLELDTGKFKMGDGHSYWNDLSYVGGESESGGSTPVMQRLGPFTVTYNMAGLNAGIDLGVTLPAGADVRDVKVAVLPLNDGWDGTTPQLDLGFATSPKGWFGYCFAGDMPGAKAGVDLTLYDYTDSHAPNVQVPWFPSLASASETFGSVWDQLSVPASGPDQLVIAGFDNQQPLIPFFVIDAQPVKVWVSQNGLPGGAAPGGTKGSAQVYIYGFGLTP